MHRHRSGPYSPYKIPKHRSCKLHQNRSGRCKAATGQARATSKDRENAQTQNRSVQNAQAPKSRLVQSTGRLN